MDKVKGVLLVLVLVLGAGAFVLFLQSSAAKADVRDALVLSAATREMLRVQGVRCAATPEQFTQLAQCIAPVLQQKDFTQEAFRQPDHRTGEPGYLVIKNANKRVYDGANFTFLFDREEIAHGCKVQGEIGPEVTCRVDLMATCEKGSILEVFYYPVAGEQARVFLKTC